MAEGLLNFTRLDDPPELLDNTQGRPLSPADEVRVVGPDDSPAAPGEEGELLVRGPYTINGYFRAGRDNERSFDPDGFYRSGDLVRLRDDGYLVVTGRVKDVICRCGETIGAQDIEEQLLTHPDVWSAAAVPLPDPDIGERICAAVVFAGPPATLAQLNAHLEQRGVATHARLDQLVALPSLPTTPIGKIDKKAIIAQLAAR
jgi:mycobactin salicyl-AMP ligase